MDKIKELLEKGDEAFASKNYQEAVKLYEEYLLENLKADNKEFDSLASYRLAICYIKGLGTRRNIKHALFQLDTISDVDSDAAYLMGVNYALGLFNRPNYSLAFKYFNHAYNLQIDGWPVNYAFPYSILIGDLYEHGIGVKQDKIYALYSFADGITGYAHILANRIEYTYLKQHPDNEEVFKSGMKDTLKRFDNFTKIISDMLLYKDYKVAGSKKEVSNIAKLNLKETRELLHDGNIDANTKIVYSLLLSKDYKKKLALIHRLLVRNVLKGHVHSALLIAELAFKEKNIIHAINKSYDALVMLKDHCIKLMIENLKDEKDNPLFDKAIKELELGIEDFDFDLASLFELCDEKR